MLLYRGYPIDQLAEHSSFLEVCYLLANGELPTEAEFKRFERDITYHTMLHAQFDRFFEGFRRDAHPMAIMVGTVGALAAFYHDCTDINDHKQRTIAQPSPDREDADDRGARVQVLDRPTVRVARATNSTMRRTSCACALRCRPRTTRSIRCMARALDVFMILHADHEQNASTSTVRLAGSSGANPFACISSGIACLWGPAHGGANEAALNMLEEIGTVDKIPEFIRRVKDPNDDIRLMGFGHRVYKNYDPRAKAMQKLCHLVLKEVGARRQSDAEGGDGAGEDRAERRVLRQPQALSEHRFLFRHHAAGDGLPDLDVHGAVRGGAHRRLDRAVDRDDGRRRARRSAARVKSIPARRSGITCRWRSGSNRSAGLQTRFFRLRS